MKHSKGPWLIHRHETKPDSIVEIGPDGNLLAVLYRAGGDREEFEANVKLIQSAPDLLEACKAAKAVMEAQGINAGNKIVGEQYSIVVNAIKKATE